MLWWNGVRYAPNGMIYSGDTPRREPLDPENEDFMYFREGSYYEPDWKKTSYKITPPLSEELNSFQDRFSENEILYSRWKLLETTVQQIWEDIKHTFFSRGKEIKSKKQMKTFYRIIRWFHQQRYLSKRTILIYQITQ